MSPPRRSPRLAAAVASALFATSRLNAHIARLEYLELGPSEPRETVREEWCGVNLLTLEFGARLSFDKAMSKIENANMGMVGLRDFAYRYPRPGSDDCLVILGEPVFGEAP